MLIQLVRGSQFAAGTVNSLVSALFDSLHLETASQMKIWVEFKGCRIPLYGLYMVFKNKTKYLLLRMLQNCRCQ